MLVDHLVRTHVDFAHHGVKHTDFFCFKSTTYITLTLCDKSAKFFLLFLIISNVTVINLISCL